MTALLQTIEGGLLAACAYALVGFSWNAVHNSCGYLNLAIGHTYVITAIVMAEVAERATSLPIWVDAIVAVVVAGIGGWIVERVVLRPLTRGGLAPLIATVGVALVLEQLARWLAPELAVRPPDWIAGPPLHLGGVIVARQEVVILTVAIVVTMALLGFFQFTDLGRQFRATADDPDSAVAIGLDIRRVATIAFVVSTMVAGIAAVSIAPITGVAAGTGELMAVKAFLAVSIGGLGSYRGGVVGAIGVGVAEAVLTRYFGVDVRDLVVLSGFVVLLVVGRPQWRRTTGVSALRS